MTCGGADLGRGGKSAEKPPTQHGGQHEGQDTHRQKSSSIQDKFAKGHGQTTKCITDMLKM